MNKLQLYITKSIPVYKCQVNFNPAEDVRSQVEDVRHVLNNITYDFNEKNIFYLVTAIEQGVFLTILRTIPPEQGNYLATWIFVPNGLKISDAELAEVVHTTTRKVSNPRLDSSDMVELRALFSREYEFDPEAPAIVANNPSGEYAHRYYGGETGFTLDDFLGDKLYQPAYIGFRGVLLLDADLGIEAMGADLTAEELRQCVTLLPPEKAGNFTPNIFHHVLNKPYRVALGDDLTITWRRAGFEDVKSVMTITSDRMRPQMPETDDSRKTISPASFLITSRSSHEPLTGCSIRVNGKDVSNGVQFTNADLQNASVSITCEGFAPYSGNIDLASTTQALIHLQERRKLYRFELPVKSSYLGAPIKFDIYTMEELNESPIEGYVLLDDIQEGKMRTNHLAYSRSDSTKSLIHKGLLVLAGIVVGVVISMLCTKCSGAGNPDGAVAPNDSVHIEQAEQQSGDAEQQKSAQQATTDVSAQATEPEPTPEQKQQAQDIANGKNISLADAVKYLDENTVWDRETMERYPSLKGLFDDMNTMNRENLTGKWATTLKDSKRFAKVAEHASLSLKKGIKVKEGKHDPTYNKPGDFKIQVQGYLNWIDRKM